MELDTIIAIAALVMAMNAPFYYMSLQNSKWLGWIRRNCPMCIRRQKQGGDNDG